MTDLIPDTCHLSSGAERPGAERVRSARAAELLGISRRQVQDMALDGRIPGAARIGGLWTFDESRLRRWIKQQERETCRKAAQRTSDCATAFGTAGPASMAASSREAYELAIGLKPGAG